jgi:antitoxin component YwqK of YwqJK toxin-antitoxin module
MISCNVIKENYETGEVKSKGKFSNSLKIGKWKTFYKSGKLFMVGY